MFAYCSKNPVNCIDPTGEAWWPCAIAAVVVAACAIAVVATCGGAAAAIAAVGAVASGTILPTMTRGATIAAGAFIGSSMVFGGAAMLAEYESNSMQKFCDQGNWETGADLLLRMGHRHHHYHCLQIKLVPRQWG